MRIVIIYKQWLNSCEKVMNTSLYRPKIHLPFGNQSGFNLNASKKDGLPTSTAIGLSAAAHIIVALVLVQQIKLPAATTNKLRSPITINLMAETKKQETPSAQPSVQKVVPKSQAKPVISTANTSNFAVAEKPLITHQETANKEIRETESKVDPSPAAATPALPEAAPKADASPVYVAPKFSADYLRNPSPEYPSLARRKGEQGRVLLKVFVTAQGNPEKVLLEKSSGSELLDKSALDVVKTWKFIPASANNQAVSGVVIVPIKFSLDS